MTTGIFVPHCDDDENCSMGSFHYECAACHKHVIDYDAWFKEEDVVVRLGVADIECERCKAGLRVFWDDKELEVRVEVRKMNLDTENVHCGNCVEMFALAWLAVPGEKPRIVCTPRFIKNTNDADRNKNDTLEQLVQTAIIDSAHDIAREVRRHLGLPEK